jgi:hypothetical protein
MNWIYERSPILKPIPEEPGETQQSDDDRETSSLYLIVQNAPDIPSPPKKDEIQTTRKVYIYNIYIYHNQELDSSLALPLP